MAAPEEIVTVDAVCAFFASNDGRATNKELVAHFRNPHFDQQQKEYSRELLKSVVNKVATIKTGEAGDRYLVLKREFEPEPLPPPPDFSSSLLDDVLSAFQTPNSALSTESRAEATEESSDVSNPGDVEATSQIDVPEVEPPKLPISRTKLASGASSTPPLPPSCASRAPLPSYEQLFVKSSPHSSPTPAAASLSKPNSMIVEELNNPVPPPRKASRGASVKSNASSTKENSQSGEQPPKPPRLPLKEVNTKPSAALASPEDMSLGSESVTTGSATDIADVTPTTPGSIAGDMEMAEENSIVSVKERALKLNKIQSESELQKQVSPPRKKAGDRTSTIGSEDDGHSTTSGSIELTKEQRSWLIVAATSDYHPMAKMLNTNPSLAKMKDFISGYTALHWASKSGQLEVVKLVAGCGADVNAKSNGGYTPLHLAAIQGHQEIMSILEDVYGANPNLRDHGGKRPKQYVKNSTVQILFNGQSSGHITAAAQGFAQRGLRDVNSSDEEDSTFHRSPQSASFSARVKRTRDHFLAHFLHGVDGGGGGETSGGAVKETFFLPPGYEAEPLKASQIDGRRGSSLSASFSAGSLGAPATTPGSRHSASSSASDGMAVAVRRSHGGPPTSARVSSSSGLHDSLSPSRSTSTLASPSSSENGGAVARSVSSVSPKKTKRRGQRSSKRRQNSGRESGASDSQREKEAKTLEFHQRERRTETSQQQQQQQITRELNNNEIEEKGEKGQSSLVSRV